MLGCACMVNPAGILTNGKTLVSSLVILRSTFLSSAIVSPLSEVMRTTLKGLMREVCSERLEGVG